MSDDLKGLDIQIGGNVDQLKQALRAAELAFATLTTKVKDETARQTAESDKLVAKQKEVADRVAAIRQDAENRMVAATKTASEARIHMLEQEGEAQHKAILETVKDRKQAEELIFANAKSIEAQITKVQAEEATKQAAIAKQLADQRRNALTMVSGAAFAGLSVAVKDSLSSFAAFEGVMNQINAVADVSGKELDGLRQQAIKLGADTKFSAKEAADGMAELAKAGFTATEIAASIEGVLATAAAAGTSVAQAAEIAGGALRGFGLEAAQAGKVADVLAQAANKSALDVKDIGESLKYIAPVARAANQSFEDVSAMLAVMGNQMIKGSEAGTSLRTAIVSFEKPTGEARKVLSDLHISVQDTTGKMLPLMDIIGQLRDKTKSWTDINKAAAIETIVGREALSGVLALVNTAPDAYNAMADSMNNATGAAKDMADKMNAGLGASLDQLKGSVETLGIALGTELAPSAKAIVDSLTGMVNFFVALPEPVKEAAAAATVAAMAFTGLLTVIGAAGIALPILGLAVAGLGLELGPVAVLAGVAALAMGGLAAVAKESADAQSREREEVIQATTARATAIQKCNEHAQEISNLVEEHDHLIEKTHLTADEQKRLDAITDQMKKNYPQLATAIDGATGAHWSQIAVIEQEITHQQQLQQEIYRTLQAEVDLRRALFVGAGKDLATAQAGATSAADDSSAQGDLMSGGSLAGAGMALQARGRQNAANSAVQQKITAFNNASDVFSKANQALEEGMRHMQNGPGFPGMRAPAGRGGAVTPAPTRAKKGPKPKSGASDANREYNEEKKLAQEEAKLEEELAKRKLATDKAVLESKISNLNFQKEMGVKTQQDYLLALEGFKKQEIALDTKAATDKIDAQKKATTSEIAAAQVAASKGAKGKADEIKVLNQHLATLDAERIGVIQKGEAKTRQLHQDTTQAITLADKKAAGDTAVILADSTDKQIKLRRQAELVNLEGLAKQRAEVEATYQDELQAIHKTYAADLEATDKRTDLSNAQKDAIKAQAEAVASLGLQLANIKRDKGVEDVGKTFTKSVRDMQGALMALAVDPSMERIANAIQSLAGDKSKLDEFRDVIKEIGAAFNAAGGGAEGFQAAMSTIAGSIDPVTIALTGILAVWQQLAKGFRDTTKEIQDYASKTADLNLSAEEREANQVQDPTARATAKFNAALERLNKETSDAVAKSNQDRASTGNIFHDAPIANLTLDDADKDPQIAAIKRDHDAKYKDLLASYNSATQDVVDTSKTRAEDAAKAWQKSFDDSTGAMADALTKYQNTYADIVKAQTEIDKGGIDARGNLISLMDEARNKATQRRLDGEAKYNQLKDDQIKKEAELLKLNQDEADAIAKIMGEGIAQRAKTETQDKLERINKLKADNNVTRQGLNDEIASLKVKMDLERQASDDEQASIMAIAGRRLEALNAEIAKGNALLEQSNKQLQIEQARYALMLAWQVAGLNMGTAVGASGGGASGSSGSRVYTDAEVRQYDKTGYPKFHTGGMVPGLPGTEVPAILTAGERVLNPAQTAAYNAGQSMMRDRPPTSVVSGNTIIIQGGAIPDPKRHARLIDKELGNIARRGGGNRL